MKLPLPALRRRGSFVLGLVLLSSPAPAAVIDWGSFVDAGASPHTTVVDGVTIEFWESMDFLPEDQPYLQVRDNGGAKAYTVTFSEPVNYSQGFGHLNGPGEWVTFSLPSTAVDINTLHTWTDSSLTENGSGALDFSTVSWTQVSSVTFTHIGGDLIITDGSFVIPEPASWAILLAALALTGRRSRRN